MLTPLGVEPKRRLSGTENGGTLALPPDESSAKARLFVVPGQPRLQLDRLGTGVLPGVTAAYGASLAEAAAVCLEDQEHSSGVELKVSGSGRRRLPIEWAGCSAHQLRCWEDAEFATEQGAYGLAALLVEALTDLTVTHRSIKGTGFDYWLGMKSDPGPLFQDKARLEVSGIRRGDRAAIRWRVRKKLAQTTRSDGRLPALVVVVEFGQPCSQVAQK